MSRAINRAIYQRAVGTEPGMGSALSAVQQAFAARVALDPETGLPAVHWGNVNRAKKADGSLLVPCLIFRSQGGSLDGRFGVDTGPVDNTYYALEVWGASTDESEIADVEEQVELLFDHRRGVATALPLAAGKTFWAELVSPSNIGFDSKLNAWYGLRLIRFVEARF